MLSYQTCVLAIEMYEKNKKKINKKISNIIKGKNIHVNNKLKIVIAVAYIMSRSIQNIAKVFWAYDLIGVNDVKQTNYLPERII